MRNFLLICALSGTFFTLSGCGKTADGLQALRWWQQGRLLEIAEYCAYDVKVTKCVHEYGARNGHVKYNDRTGREQTVAVEWSLD